MIKIMSSTQYHPDNDITLGEKFDN